MSGAPLRSLLDPPCGCIGGLVQHGAVNGTAVQGFRDAAQWRRRLVSGTCTDRVGNVSAPRSFGLKYDATAPAVDKGLPGRPGDANGWYNRPVSIDFSGTDLLSGVQACTSTTYSGPDSSAAKVTGTCTDVAGNRTGPLDFGFKYDETDPVVLSATPDRPPDARGWFNHVVSFAIAGMDETSQIAACPAVTYEGPDSATGSVVGQCRDHAGNVSSRAFGLMFDATAPPIMDLAATAADRSVAVSWRTTEDAETVEVVRTPGVGRDGSTLVFSGPGTSFVDAQVENGVQYAYEVRVQDPAGNAQKETVTATPTAPPALFEAGAAGALADAVASGRAR